MHFVLVRDTPFVPGDVITVKLIPISDPQGPLLSPGGVGVPEIIQLQVRYQGNPIDYFSYEADSRKLVETTVKVQPDTTSFAKEFGMEVEIENFQPGWFLTHLQRTFPVRFELQYSQAMSNRCVTPSGTCYVQQSGPIGSPCWCNTPWGPVTGVLQ